MRQPPHRLPEPSAIRVVIVDDDLLVRTMLSRLLDSNADLIVVNTHADGAAALEAITVDSADVMLVDVSMPRGMGGVELTRRVRELSSTVKVIALTSLTDEGTVAEMLQAGATGFLFKDTPHAAIADAIRAAHSGLSVLTPQALRPLEGLSQVEVPKLTEVELSILNAGRPGAHQRADRTEGLPVTIGGEVPRRTIDREARRNQSSVARREGWGTPPALKDAASRG